MARASVRRAPQPAARRGPLLVDWYDYPALFELAFADETGPEVAFLSEVFARFARRPVRHVLEAACGGGRLLAGLAARGYRAAGFDRHPQMLAYAARRLRRRALAARVFSADMANFAAPRRYDAICNTFNSFRHLLTEEAALSHLRCVSAALQPDGLFILGLHLLPPDASDESCERWTAQRGRTSLCATLRVVAANRRARWERLRISLRVQRPAGLLRLRSEFVLRTYSARQLRRLLAGVPELELCATYDFCYELDRPLRLTDDLSDVVLVLRKRG